jgi:LemA protein
LIFGAVAVVAVLILIGWFVSINNRLVSLDEARQTQWAQVETVLQRRYDLIPNLVETVKGYAAHEREILEEVTRLRSQWGEARTVDQQATAAGQLEGALARLLLVAERYPDLKANQNFRDLQVELAGTENRISVERQRYNEAVRRIPRLCAQRCVL